MRHEVVVKLRASFSLPPKKTKDEKTKPKTVKVLCPGGEIGVRGDEAKITFFSLYYKYQ